VIARLLAIVAGLWLVASPAVLGYVDTTAESSDRIVGPLAAASSFVAIWGITRALRWTTLPLGAWCVLGPWLLGFPTEATVSNLVVGAVLAASAFFRGEVGERYGGGWMSLRERRPGVGGGSA
jgi:hypothetical protein